MTELPDHFTELDRTLMDVLLAGDDPILAALRDQYAQATCSGHDYTGVGFFTHFAVSPSARRVSRSTFDIDDIWLDIAGVKSGAMAILAIREGVIDYLEVVTITDEWPENPVLRSVTYQSVSPGSPKPSCHPKNAILKLPGKHGLASSD